jgi:hypothetical protein
MFTLLLASLVACDEIDASTPGAGPKWSEVYGECSGGTMQAVGADDLGTPYAMMVEFETANGWVPFGIPADLNASFVQRREDSGLWISCPTGARSWRVAWAR